MGALFVALGIMVLALLALLLWFVPHLLQQQAARVSTETAQLREMLLDLLNEQEAVAVRQAQLGTTLTSLQGRLETFAEAPSAPASVSAELVDARIGELQHELIEWLDGRQTGDRARTQQDNESWAYLMSLLAAIQDRIGTLSQERTAVSAGVRAGVLLNELEEEMTHLRSISEDISKLQQRLRRSLSEHETGIAGLRTAVPATDKQVRAG